MTKARLLEKLDAEVERWNAKNQVGTRVMFLDFGSTTTATPAFIHEGRSCVRLSAPAVVAELAEIRPC
jgi:hypothetical protein